MVGALESRGIGIGWRCGALEDCKSLLCHFVVLECLVDERSVDLSALRRFLLL